MLRLRVRIARATVPAPTRTLGQYSTCRRSFCTPRHDMDRGSMPFGRGGGGGSSGGGFRGGRWRVLWASDRYGLGSFPDWEARKNLYPT